MRSMRKRLGFTASSHPVVEGAARPVYDEPQPVSVAFISETGAAASSRPLARRGGRAATTSEAIHGYPSGAVRVMRHPASSRYGRRCCGLQCGGAREWYGVAATAKAGGGECVEDAGAVPAVCPGRGNARQPAQRSQGAACTGASVEVKRDGMGTFARRAPSALPLY